MTERPADMLDLPTELRCMIDENIPFKGKIVVYAKYELEQAIEPATSALLLKFIQLSEVSSKDTSIATKHLNSRALPP